MLQPLRLNMSGENVSKTGAHSRWLGYLMFIGLFCIVAGMLSRLILSSMPLLEGISTAMGYFGLLLILVGFFIQVLTE